MQSRNEEQRDKARRIQSQDQHDADAEQHRETGQVSQEVEHQPERTGRAIRKKSRKRSSRCSVRIAGGIIRRLIQSAQNRKAEAEAEIEELEGLLAELQKQLDENQE
jgi:ABC-type Zn2+ transport system substrate-binding protein/surface adhesin